MTENNIEYENKLPENTQRQPDDCGTISVEGFIKIYDPNTKEVIVETRA
jgi:hypothetical protein